MDVARGRSWFVRSVAEGYKPRERCRGRRNINAMIKILLDFQPLLPTTSHAVLENQGEKFCCGCGFQKKSNNSGLIYE